MKGGRLDGAEECDGVAQESIMHYPLTDAYDPIEPAVAVPFHAVFKCRYQ